MQILSGVEGCSILDKIKNEEIGIKLEIESLTNNTLESRLATNVRKLIPKASINLQSLEGKEKEDDPWDAPVICEAGTDNRPNPEILERGRRR